ncbi:MAG: sodium-dependent transporter [Firmicutes bacterium]|nr:sodium-dependent transporter [Bacillota bacterium]
MSEQAVKKEGWGSAFGFIITSIGYAVGLGAIWKFPYMIGMNGGGVFLLVCFLLIMLVAVPLCWAELTLGRYTQKSVIVGMRDLTRKGSPWVVLGWTGLATCMILASYYITIVSDVMFYIFKFVSGGLNGMSIQEISSYYSALQVDMPYKFITVIILYAATVLVLMGGVQKGLERANKILIPALFGFLLILGVRGLMLPDGIEGVIWMFTPDFSLLNGSVIMAALNQCFFLSGVAMASLFAFGSYLDRENTDIPFSGSVIVMSNLVVAILAGAAIFTSLFAYDMDVTSGAGLVFQTLPYVFCDMPGGMIWGTLFFLLVFAAGWSSMLGLYEGATSVIVDSLGIGRKKALLIATAIMFVLTIPTVLGTTVWVDVRPLGMDLFTFMDFVAMLVTLPIGAVLISLFVGLKFWDKFMEHVNTGAKYFKLPNILRVWYVVVLPAITILVVIFGIKGYF